MSCDYRVEMSNIKKSFGGVHALKDVTFKVKPGEIHALVGENGAGKSTLMKILSGAYQRDSGEIIIDGETIQHLNPDLAKKLGIGIIYQEFALAPDLSVAENIFIAKLGDKKGFVNWSELYRKAVELIGNLGFNIDPRSKVEDLSVAYQQVVEITKALSENVRILILDEPTAVLAPSDVEYLFKILFKLKAMGVSIIYISHRLEEIFQIADQITVIKDGAVMGTVLPKDVNNEAIISMMIGRSISTMFPKRNCSIGEEVFRVQGLNRGNKVRDVSFSVRKGEVLGIAGLVGSGRTEVLRAIFGADAKESGIVELEDELLNIKTPKNAVKHGIGLVPENRKEHGVILDFSVRKNITMPSIKRIANRLGIIPDKYEKSISNDLIKKLSIKTENCDTEVANLSGGNQQKVALAKWFNYKCKVILLDEPTRGVDVGAKVEIYNLINELAKEGLAIIVVSSEMLEVIGICDRVIVMNEGRMTGILEKEELSEENIMKLAIQKGMNF